MTCRLPSPYAIGQSEDMPAIAIGRPMLNDLVHRPRGSNGRPLPSCPGCAPCLRPDRSFERFGGVLGGSLLGGCDELRDERPTRRSAARSAGPAGLRASPTAGSAHPSAATPRQPRHDPAHRSPRHPPAPHPQHSLQIKETLPRHRPTERLPTTLNTPMDFVGLMGRWRLRGGTPHLIDQHDPARGRQGRQDPDKAAFATLAAAAPLTGPRHSRPRVIAIAQLNGPTVIPAHVRSLRTKRRRPPVFARERCPGRASAVVDASRRASAIALGRRGPQGPSRASRGAGQQPSPPFLWTTDTRPQT